MTAASACRTCLRAATAPLRVVSSFERSSLRQSSHNVARCTIRPPQSLRYSPFAPTQIRAYSSHPPPPGDVKLDDSAPASARLANELRENATPITETYVAYGATEALFKECARQADYIIPQALEKGGEAPRNAAGEDIGLGTGWWYENLGLTPTFNTWAQVTFLHMYLLTVRLRYFPEEFAAIWMQHLHDHFFYEAEHRMTIFHDISSRGVRNRYLKELYNQWRGVQGAYDEGLIRGDAVLAAAVWRNIFKADDNVDWRHVALVVSFMRRSLAGLDRAKDQTIVGAMVKFGSPMSETAVVDEPSKLMDEPFGPRDEEDLQKLLKDLEDAPKKK